MGSHHLITDEISLIKKKGKEKKKQKIIISVIIFKCYSQPEKN